MDPPGAIANPPNGGFTVIETMIEVFELIVLVLGYLMGLLYETILFALAPILEALGVLTPILEVFWTVIGWAHTVITNICNEFSFTRMCAEAFCAHITLFAAAGISTLTKDPDFYSFIPNPNLNAPVACPCIANMEYKRTFRDRLTLHHIAGSTAMAFTTIFQSYAMRVVPGAHVNSVYTFTALFFPGHFKQSNRNFVRWQAPCIILGQTLGYFSAAGLLRLMLHPDTEIGLTLPVIEDPNAPLIPILEAIAAEVITTSWQVFARIGLYKDDDLAANRGFVQSGVAFMGSLLGGFFSGGSMNTMRSIATAVVSNRYDYLYIYLIGPPLGGILGALEYSMFEALVRRDVRRAQVLAEEAAAELAVAELIEQAAAELAAEEAAAEQAAAAEEAAAELEAAELAAAAWQLPE